MNGPILFSQFQKPEAWEKAREIGGRVVEVDGGAWAVITDEHPLPAAWAPQPTARATDPDTSHRAAQGVKADTDRARALLAHADHPEGLTDFELGDLINRKQTSAGKRRHELVAVGLVERLDLTRPSDTGTDAHVWRITHDGIAEANRLKEIAA